MSSSTTSTGPRASSASPRSRLSSAVGAAVCVSILALAGCLTPLSPSQRQDLETRTYQAPYEATFASCRDAFVNFGYVIESSDFGGGVLAVSNQKRRHNPNTALALSIVVPPAGDFYMQRFGWAILDLLLWPFSIVWAAPSNYQLARTRMVETRGTVSVEGLKSAGTRVRITVNGIDWDTKKYPVLIRSLHEEIERQLFIKAGDTLGGEPQ